MTSPSAALMTTSARATGSNPSSAMASAIPCRTLIETTCKTILIDRGQTPDDAWEAPKLIAETTKFLHLGIHDGGHTDPTLKSGAEKLVRGVNSIIDGVVEIRNAHGAAAHGSDAYAPMLDARYAEILARATDAVVGLLFKTHLNGSGKAPLARLRYGDHKDFDEWIDSDFGPFEVLDSLDLLRIFRSRRSRTSALTPCADSLQAVPKRTLVGPDWDQLRRADRQIFGPEIP
jgi:Abortive infection C-terminus